MEALDLSVIGNHASLSETTNRDGFSIIRNLSIEPDFIRGKSVLDIGAGMSNFTAIAKRFGATRAIAYDANYGDRFRRPVAGEDMVIGYAQLLPFADKSFDLVIASFSLFWVEEGLEESLREALRVLADGGIFIASPVALRDGKSVPEGVKLVRSSYGDYTMQTTKPYSLKNEHFIAGDLADSLSFQPLKYSSDQLVSEANLRKSPVFSNVDLEDKFC